MIRRCSPRGKAIDLQRHGKIVQEGHARQTQDVETEICTADSSTTANVKTIAPAVAGAKGIRVLSYVRA